MDFGMLDQFKGGEPDPNRGMSPDVVAMQQLYEQRQKDLRTAAQVRAAGGTADYGPLGDVGQKLEDIDKRMRSIIDKATYEFGTMDAKALDAAVQRNDLLKKDLELQKAIAELATTSEDKLSVAARNRIENARKVLAIEKAVTETTGKAPSAHDLQRVAIQQAKTKPGFFDVRGQADEFKAGLGRASAGLRMGDTAAITRLIGESPLLALTAGNILANVGTFAEGNTENQGIRFKVPFLGGVRLPFSDYGNVTRQGQVTGEGYGAGVAARMEAFSLGANPFDIISNEVAKAIVAGVRGKGFRGAMARAFEGSVAGVVSDLGIDPNQAIQIGERYARTDRLDYFRHLMSGMDDIAKDTHRSLQEVVDGQQQLADALRKFQGGRADATGQAINAALNRSFQQFSGPQQTQLRQWFTAALPVGSGMTPQMAFSPGRMPTAVNLFQRQIEMQRGVYSRLRGQARQDFLENATMNPLFQGLDADMIDQILRNPNDFFDQFRSRNRAEQVSYARGGAQSTFTETRRGAVAAALRTGSPQDYFKSMEDQRFFPGTTRFQFDSSLARVTQGGKTLYATEQGQRLLTNQLRDRLFSMGYKDDQTREMIQGMREAIGSPQEFEKRFSQAQKQTSDIFGARAKAADAARQGTANQMSATFQFDAGETRRLFSGKRVTKEQKLEQSRTGATNTYGTGGAGG